MQSTVESMMTRMMSTAFRLGVAETACRVGVLCADSVERFSKNRQEEENTITFRLKCIVIA